MNTDDVDTLLHQHARRWTQRQSAPPPLPDLPATSPTLSQWRTRVLILAACLAVGIVAVVAVPSRRPINPAVRPSGPTLPAVVRDRLVQLVDRMARPNRGPVTAQAVRTTYARAEATVFDGDTTSSPPPYTPVWVVQVRGDFDCGGCKIPPGEKPPHGHVYTFVVTAGDYGATGYTMGDHVNDLARLGTVTDLIR